MVYMCMQCKRYQIDSISVFVINKLKKSNNMMGFFKMPIINLNNESLTILENSYYTSIKAICPSVYHYHHFVVIFDFYGSLFFLEKRCLMKY